MPWVGVSRKIELHWITKIHKWFRMIAAIYISIPYTNIYSTYLMDFLEQYFIYTIYIYDVTFCS